MLLTLYIDIYLILSMEAIALPPLPDDRDVPPAAPPEPPPKMTEELLAEKEPLYVETPPPKYTRPVLLTLDAAATPP